MGQKEVSIHASQDYSWGREHGLDLQIVDIHDCDSLFSPLGRGFNCIASSCAVLLVSRLEGFNCIASSCAVLLVCRLEGFNCIASSCAVLLVPRLQGFNCIASSCAVLLVSRLEGFNCIASSCVCVFVWKLTAIPLRVMRFDSRLSTVRLVLTLRTSANC